MHPLRRWATFLISDPRHGQIAVLGALMLYGVFGLDLEIDPKQAAVTLATALFAQWACTRIWRLPTFDPRSALISGLSLCLLLRTNHLPLAALAAALAITVKFAVRWNGKHVFNPTNFAIAALVLGGAPVWISPGQWGSVAIFWLLVGCAGITVATRARRADVALAFLGFWSAILVARSLRLHDPMTIPAHRLENGALVIFSFFMISDPKSTPDSRAGRILFALLVACGTWYVQFKLFRPSGPIWSLALFSLATPLIDRILPGPRYQWPGGPSPSQAPSRVNEFKGERHETAPNFGGGLVAGRAA